MTFDTRNYTEEYPRTGLECGQVTSSRISDERENHGKILTLSASPTCGEKPAHIRPGRWVENPVREQDEEDNPKMCSTKAASRQNHLYDKKCFILPQKK